jgi:hypothetical protein
MPDTETPAERPGFFVETESYQEAKALIDDAKPLFVEDPKHLGQFVFMGTTEVGPINQVVFMWAYESMADRAKRRGAMAQDPAWGEFGKATAAFGALKQQTNMILKPTSFSPIR